MVLDKGVRMNEKCKYCDYVSKCSRICEYNSILCKIQRSFPKVVDKSYEQLQQENKQLKDNWDKLRELILEEGFEINTREYGSLDVIDKNVILEKMQELEQGRDNQ